ncbi:efflux RND transporter periplasmic adaptor subunit [Candidatus Magnetaquicoccus inordinatus]|uniref:efflux RND transporter periplasmic adaptor subunit n=1 Tax=Candidatus Magnetaquicoccus inordinatus TaxID=2496818 RepID=UPI00102C6A15|nr:efflux RND transporter periplasmic adaptor subunit [Candidatus Magnetaquicoccus inordinatus]
MISIFRSCRPWLCSAALLLLGSHAALAAPPAPVLSVRTTPPQTLPWTVSESSSGAITAWQEAVVAAEIGGLAIIELAVDVGSVVRRGQRLILLSQESVKASRNQQRANVAKAEAGRDEAQANAERARKVKDSGALSEQQITQYLLAEKSAKASLLAAEAALLAEEVRLKQTEILAADDGIITARTATLGSVVQPGVELLRLLRQNRLEWRAELTAEQMLSIQAGQKARLTLTDGQQLEGVVRLVAPTLDSSNRKAIAYIDLPKESPARAGMFAQGDIVIGQKEALTVPQSALVLRDGNHYLFVVPGKEKSGIQNVEQVKVQTGGHIGDRVELLSPLPLDARVVVSGGAFLKQGDRVQVNDDTSSDQERKP